jgi:hypothetical protein
MSVSCSQFCVLSASAVVTGHRADYLEASDDIGERVLKIAAAKTDLRCGRIKGRFARDAQGPFDSGVIAAVTDGPCHTVIIAGSHCATSLG